MKKLINRLRKPKNLPPSSRITTETVAEHREHILAGGRKFKYPLQYVRHKLVINAIILSLTALVAAVTIGWWQLYPMQNTTEFMYRVTKVIPVPVANVDGQPVLYSDYLMKYLSSVHFLETKEQLNQKTDDGKRQLDYIKQQSMQDAISDAYALKLARSMNISVSDSEFQDFLKDKRQTSNGEISEQSYNAIVLDWFGWSPDEYKHMTESKLLSQKVAYAMDKDAQSAIDKVEGEVTKDSKVDFNQLATSIGKQTGQTVTYGTSGWVPKFNQDGGLSLAAAKLNKGEVSSVIKSSLGKGYYIVRLLDIEDTQVKYEYIQVPLTAFTKSLASLEKQHKVTRYISVPELTAASGTTKTN
jgi:hypothetical protein